MMNLDTVVFVAGTALFLGLIVAPIIQITLLLSLRSKLKK